MTTPIQVGLPQVVLFIVAVVGLVLLISSVSGLVGGRGGRLRSRGEEEEAEKFGRAGHRRYRRVLRLGRGMSGVVLLLLAVSLLWLTFLLQTYLGLTGNIKVAQIHATAIRNIPHLMSVELTLYDQNGHVTSQETYGVNGDEWMLQGDIVKFPTWMNVVGIHSSYKLTRLEGRYDKSDLERHATHTVVDLNGGDDQFFTTAQEQAWVSPMVEAAYGNAVFLAADGKTYNVFVSQTGLFAEPAR